MIKLPYFADPKNLVVEEDRPVKVADVVVDDGPEGRSSLELLQTIYRDRTLPLNVRVRCAVEALPFENPKLSATAIATMDGKSFAAALERAIERSKAPLPQRAMIEHEPLVPSEELRKPFTTFRRF
jgi:hypothetical protein